MSEHKGRGRQKRRRTPLNGFEDCSFEGLREPGVHGLGLLLFAVERLKVVEAALASDLALKLLEPIEGHPRCVRSGEREGETRGMEEGGRGGTHSKVSKISPVCWR